MKSLSKLVQEKRVKMLVLCLFLFGLIFLKNAGSATDLTYIVRREGDKLLPSCIGEGDEKYEGIGWTYPLPTNGDLPEEESFYLPALKNDYNCKFSYQEHCTTTWSSKNWMIDTNTSRRYDFISDERWGDFPTHYVSNATKGIENRIEISRIFNLGFSVRASDQIELFVCEGWDPSKYSCYYFNVTNKEIRLSKHRTMSENDVSDAATLDSYKAFSNIIVLDEWRNFEISVDRRRIGLRDINLNRTVIDMMDGSSLIPAYLIFRSKSPSLWKIHQNSFFYTTSDQISRMGPTLRLYSEDLCVNLFVRSCAHCVMTFFMIENGTRSLLEQRQLKKSGEWSLIRLSKEQLTVDKLNLFVQTSYKQGAEKKDGFWAIDDVRVCHKNEIKISLLKSLNGLTEDDTKVSCQIVDKPNLRPTKTVLDHLTDYPTIESVTDSSSINLTWTREKSKKDVEYFVSYQANDICSDPPFNIKRMKSNGFIVTKSNGLSLKDLIPYTTYNITFSTMLHLTEKHMTVNTKESPYISLEEQPSRIQIDEVTDTTVRISWDKVDCRKIYGHIIYTLELLDQKRNNITDLGDQTDNSRTITGLHPFRKYTMNIGTYRSVDKPKSRVKKFSTSVSFTTKPGLASPPKNPEVYASASTTLSIRYDLPDEKEGHPIELHITRCNPLIWKKCKMLQRSVTHCKQFPGKYCVDIPNLIPQQKQMIGLSLKNDGSYNFGKEVTIEGFTEERVPGKPTNITTKLVDCDISQESCNLNISWIHPYDQNGTITAFYILLNSSETMNNETTKRTAFEEIYKLADQDYLPQYTYQIKYVPNSKQYNLYIQSVNNELKSPFTTKTIVQTADLGDLIDQSPTLVKTAENFIEFELKPAHQRLSTTLTVIVQDYDEKKDVDETIAKQIELNDNLCNEFGETWISQTVKIDNTKQKITVGQSDSSGKSLKPKTKYCITFIMENEYQNSTHENVYYETVTTLSHSEAHIEAKADEASGGLNILLIILIIVLILVLVGVLSIWYLKKRKNSRQFRSVNSDENEHAYESLPFEDTIANNNMYDQLEHK